MGKWLGAPFLGCLHPADAQNKTLISNTGSESLNQGLETHEEKKKEKEEKHMRYQ